MKRQKRKEKEEEEEEEEEEKKINKEEESAEEDWCFVCKDGGDLMLCDYPDCLKVYHPCCARKTKFFADTGKCWICRKHSCALCLGTPNFYCFCCPNSVCQHCRRGSKFTEVRGNKGFCKECFELVLLAEKNSEYGLNGVS